MATRQEIPHHVNPPNDPPGKPVARAPYNFVPLPQAIYTVDDGIEIERQRDGQTVMERVKPWDRHDEFIPGTHSGWLDLRIETLTPIFIRGAVRQENGEWNLRESRLRPKPYLDHQDRPTIPGSTLRGMIRNLVEILSYSKIQPVSNKRPFFRTVSPGRVGEEYRRLMVRNDRKPQGGFAERRGDDWIIVPAVEVLRVPHTIFPQQFDYRQHPTYRPDWRWQQTECWFQRGHGIHATAIEFANPKSDAWESGMAVLTGSAPNKKAEFVFVGRDESRLIDVPADLVERFHDDDQITGWQQDAFPVDRPERHSRRRAGQIRDGEPVFYVCDDNGRLLFFGRAQMFRFPYDRTPAELVPAHMRSVGKLGESEAEPGTAGLDVAEVMFGRVARASIKGRVFCEDCTVTEDGEWLAPEIVPQILASPKVTAYQQYLTQDGGKASSERTTYIANDKTAIRGHKLYWHRWENGRGMEQVENTNANVSESQQTRIQAVATSSSNGTPTTFTGRVRFENLTEIELGALLAALNLPDGCAHKIGMGKPLGLGSIRIHTRLNLIDRAARYDHWNNNAATAAADPTRFTAAFTAAMIQHGQATGEATLSTNATSALCHLARLDALFTILRWEGKPSRIETEYLSLDDFRARPVLPSPHRISKLPEPDWPGPTPTSAPNAPPPASDTTQSKPTKLEKGPRYQATVDRLKKRKIEVHVELADGNWKSGWIENADDVPESMRCQGMNLPVLFTQSTSMGQVFKFIKSE